MDVPALYDAHKNMVYRLALSFLKSVPDAEDGQTASVSPMGVVLSDWYDLSLTCADGSVYTVLGQDVDNTQFGPAHVPQRLRRGGRRARE